ncbi:MAG: helix-turn-helix domain-containing protein [Longibaculum sp.]
MSELQMFTQDEVAKLINVHRDTVTTLREVGVIKAIKTGRNYMFSQDAVRRFQHDYEGYDVSNRVKAIQAYREVEKSRCGNSDSNKLIREN